MTDSTDTRIRWREAIRALLALARHNDDTSQVFRIVDALRGRSDQRGVARLRRDPVGRRILDERRSLLALLSDRERLRALPQGSLGRVYLEFMEREGLSAEGLRDASEDGSRPSADPELRTYRERARDSHDLFHVVTGYGRDPLGELSLLGVTFVQTRNPGTAFIALMGLIGVRREYAGGAPVRAVLQGFWNGGRARWLLAQDWEALLALPLDEARRTLRLAPPSYYARSLPHRDPARSWSRPLPDPA